jgi:hypothetical protein
MPKTPMPKILLVEDKDSLRTMFRLALEAQGDDSECKAAMERLRGDPRVRSVDVDARRKIVATDEGWSRKHWKAFAELGLCAAPFQESSGGLGGGPLATMIVMQEFGRSLVVEPYFETVVLAGGLIEGRLTVNSAKNSVFARTSIPRSISWRECITKTAVIPSKKKCGISWGCYQSIRPPATIMAHLRIPSPMTRRTRRSHR